MNTVLLRDKFMPSNVFAKPMWVSIKEALISIHLLHQLRQKHVKNQSSSLKFLVEDNISLIGLDVLV